MASPTVSGANLRTAFVLLLVVAVSVLFLAVAWPFLEPLLLGALLAGLFHPLYRWITRLVGGRQSFGAVLTLLVLFILVLVPVSAFLGIVVQQALSVSDQAIPWLRQHMGAASTFNLPITFQVRSNCCNRPARRPNPQARFSLRSSRA